MSIALYNQLLEEKKAAYKGGIYRLSQIMFAYNSNRIEGSKLTEEQTRFIFETNTVISKDEESINVDDITEAANHFALFDYMLETAPCPLSEDMIKEYHAILKRGTSDSRLSWFRVGEYKSLQNTVGDLTVTSAPEKVAEDMSAMLKRYDTKENVSFESLVDFHYRFEKIHPFQDGNGRVGRMIMFKECLKNGIIPFIIEDQNKAFYYRGLSEYPKEPGYLLETCRHAQDIYGAMCEKYVPLQ